MTKWTTSKGTSICQVLGCSNPLLISKGSNSIMIDTGRSRNWSSISSKLDKLLYEKSLKALILTHTHHDHIENFINLKEKYKAKTVVHKSEAGVLCNNDFDDSYVLVDKKYDLNIFGIDGYILHTPGHSAGSISIVIDNEIAIIGDAIGDMKKKPFMKKIKKVPEDTLNSWKELLHLKCSFYIPAHAEALEYHSLVELYKDYLQDGS